MKNERNPSNRIVFGLLIVTANSFYRCFVLTKIALWFNFPIQLSILQWYGIGVIITILTIKLSDTDDNKETDREYYTKLIKHPLFITLAWSLSFIIHIIAKSV